VLFSSSSALMCVFGLICIPSSHLRTRAAMALGWHQQTQFFLFFVTFRKAFAYWSVDEVYDVDVRHHIITGRPTAGFVKKFVKKALKKARNSYKGSAGILLLCSTL